MSTIDTKISVAGHTAGLEPSLQCGEQSAPSLPELTGESLIERLAARLDSKPALLAFDADGTLWSGDVSDDVFLSACREGWLLEAALPALIEQAESLRLDASGTASQLGLALFEAQKLGLLQEIDLYAIMTWCYAGRSICELTEYAKTVLLREGFVGRLRRELSSVLKWARQSNLHCIVVSASPGPIVTWAACHWGFLPNQVIGTHPVIRNGVIVANISESVPFGANKCKLLRRHSKDLRLLASFGDSDFDFELLECADLAVAVSPKPSLYERLLPLSHAVVLITES
jgi:phosphoserine phosphatase